MQSVAPHTLKLAELEVTANQATILSVVTVLGQATPTDLAPCLQMDASTTSRNVQRLIDRHWLDITPGEDRRSHFLVAAPRGLGLLRRLRPGWSRAQQWAAEVLGDDGVSRRPPHCDPHQPPASGLIRHSAFLS